MCQVSFWGLGMHQWTKQSAPSWNAQPSETPPINEGWTSIGCISSALTLTCILWPFRVLPCDAHVTLVFSKAGQFLVVSGFGCHGCCKYSINSIHDTIGGMSDADQMAEAPALVLWPWSQNPFGALRPSQRGRNRPTWKQGSPSPAGSEEGKDLLWWIKATFLGPPQGHVHGFLLAGHRSVSSFQSFSSLLADNFREIKSEF